MRNVRLVTNRVVWRLSLATWLSHEFEPQDNCLARLEVLSCSAPTGVILQLPCMLHTYASFGDLPAMRSSHEALLGKWCKVEFNQSFCWLYSMSNFLVIQHLETLYLGENYARVVCERVWRKAQKYAFYRDSQLDLASGSQLASCQRRHMCEACKGAKKSRQLLHYRTKVPGWPGS